MVNGRQFAGGLRCALVAEEDAPEAIAGAVGGDKSREADSAVTPLGVN